jgi:hypothetical protein
LTSNFSLCIFDHQYFCLSDIEIEIGIILFTGNRLRGYTISCSQLQKSSLSSYRYSCLSILNFKLFLSIHFQSSFISKIKLESRVTQFFLFSGFVISIIGGTTSGSHSGTFANGIENDLFRAITLQYFVVKYDQSVNSNVFSVMFSSLL